MRRFVTVTLLGLALAGCSATSEPAAPVTVTETPATVERVVATTVQETVRVTETRTETAPAEIPKEKFVQCLNAILSADALIKSMAGFIDGTEKIINSEGMSGLIDAKEARDKYETEVVSGLTDWNGKKAECYKVN